MADQEQLVILGFLSLAIDIAVLWWLIFRPDDDNCHNLRWKMILVFTLLTAIRLLSLFIAAHVAGIST